MKNPLKKPSKKSGLKNLPIYLIGSFIVGLVVMSLYVPTNVRQDAPLSQVLNDIKEGRVEAVEVDGTNLNVKLKDKPQELKTRIEERSSFVETLEKSGIDPKSVKFNIKDNTTGQVWFGLLSGLLPVLLMVLFIFFIFRQARGAGDGVFSFAKSRAKVFNQDNPKISFNDVAGADEAKRELEEVVDFLKRPDKYKALGAKIPKGVLLVGPSGVGKTLMARAVAGEAGVPFLSIAGSEFMEMLVGVGASRVRDLFETAKKIAPSIIFIDEVDSIGRQRGIGIGGGHDEREQTLNQILVEMDGFEPNVGVIVMAATNRPDMLDPALVRPGRFDRRVTLDLPDIEGRKAIIKIHSKDKPMANNVDFDRLARRTVGFSGAELESMMNEAAVFAARLDKKEIEAKDVEEAALKVKLGPEKKRLQSEDDRRMTAYHEGGHALVNHLIKGLDPVHRVSIVSRGAALGFTMTPPIIDRYNETKSRLEGMIAAALGGRAAEELVFNEFTVGASSDIEKATQVARTMVTRYGMSDLGPITIEEGDGGLWSMRDSEGRYSENVKSKIDSEVKRIMGEQHVRAQKLLKENRPILDKLVEDLMKKESLDGTEFAELVDGMLLESGGKVQNVDEQKKIEPRASA